MIYFRRSLWLISWSRQDDQGGITCILISLERCERFLILWGGGGNKVKIIAGGGGGGGGGANFSVAVN